MARKTRMVLNREALHELDLAMAKGLELLAFEVLERVDPPDATPFGEGLVDRGGWLSYVDGRKVGAEIDVRRKPKGFKVRGQGVSVMVGFGFPGRFQELGTVKQPPRPFLTPVVMEVVGDRTAVETAMIRAAATFLRKKARRLERRHNLAPEALVR